MVAMVDILALGSHPDDIEFGCGGILVKAVSEGKTVALVDLTLGEKGTKGTTELRRQEALNAAAVIGATRVFLDFKDCEIIDSYENRLKLVKVIREFKPKLVLAPLWKGESNHPDHLATGLMARYACRYARFPKILPEIPTHTPGAILHYLYPTYENSDFIIDVSEHLEQWKKMMRSHESQLQGKDYVDWNIRLASKLGLFIGKEYAQGLCKGNPVVIDDVMTLSQGTREI